MRLSGKVAVVTGGGQGIGRAIALIFAREGASTAIIDVNFDSAQKVVDEITASRQRALAFEGDVSSSRQVAKATEKILNEFQKIDILVNDAGIGQPSPAFKITEEDLDQIIDVNLKGTLFCCQNMGLHMMKQKYGKIINMTSLQSHVGTPLMGAYAASKGAILALTRVLAVEWAVYGIRVNAVSPQMTKTPRIEQIAKNIPGYYDNRVTRIPLRQLCEPEDIANAVLFLASSESDMITGQAIIVDGGVTALHSAYIWPKE